MKTTNKYILTFESYRLEKIRMKNRKEREKWGKLNRKRMEREKKFLKDILVNPDETITGVVG